MSDYRGLPSIQAVTPTVCALFGIEPPRQNQAEPLPEVLQAAGSGPIERLLIYAPDAIGTRFLDRHRMIDFGFRTNTDLRQNLQSVTPPKTPVCFASMFTGAPPEVHGIRRYERPVVAIDTLFDALIRAGKRVAIVAVKDCSIDIIFSNRALDYFSETYDPEVLTRALDLLTEDRHDVILVYHQEYDDTLHRLTPTCIEAIQAAENYTMSFTFLKGAARVRWKGKRWGICATPDHGAHIDPATGRGDHCEDILEDMAVTHFWGFGK